MKKGVEIAFAIALIILSIIGTIFPTELTKDIIYAIVIPSFILSIISFVSDISALCEQDAKRVSDLEKKVSDEALEVADIKLELYHQGKYKLPFVEGVVPKEIYEYKEKSLAYLKKATISKDVQVFCIKCKKMCNILIVGGYVALFLSLFLSPYIAKLLSVIDLNCITLWSLALLYITLELKSECCNWLFNFLYNRYTKKTENNIQQQKTTE